MNSDNLLTLRQLKQYRNLVFPPCVAYENHNPFFSLEKFHDWVTPDGVKCFKHAMGGVEPDVHMDGADHEWEAVTVDVLVAYRSFVSPTALIQILPRQTASHSFFRIDNAESWIRDEAFGLFLLDFNSSKHPSATGSTSSKLISDDTSESNKTKSDAVFIKQEPSSVALGKRKAVTPEFITISSDDDDDGCVHPRLAPIKQRKKLKKEPSKPSLNILDLTAQSESEIDEKPSSHVSKPSVTKRSCSKKSKKPPKPQNAIKVTKNLSVGSVVHLNDIPTLWDITRTPTAYVIDLSENSRFKDKNLISWIRHEDQCSWDGSSGHKNGDARVIDLFGEGNLNLYCRRASFQCNGIKVCEFMDPELLNGFEGWERDDTEMAPFWQAELKKNEEEFRDPDGPLARFYNRVMESKCKLTCNGKPVIRKLAERSRYGKTTFVGCSGYRKGDEKRHRCIQIDQDLDESMVADVLTNDGKLPVSRVEKIVNDGKCSLILNYNSHQTLCSFTHIINGKAKRGRIVEHKPACDSRLIIFEPVDPEIRMVIVIPMHPHNHPRHPHAKPTLSEKEFVKAACMASGEAKIPAKALRISPTTGALLGGKPWESRVPAMTNNQRLQKFLNTINRETFPRGLEWEGVQYEVDNRESKLPKDQRYIHAVTTKGDVRLVVTMHPRIVKHIHEARFLVLDYTFKRIRGDMNEWEVAGHIDRYKSRITFASLYCNKSTREAFNIIFQEFFDAVHRITGKKLEFTMFNPSAKLLLLIFDAEVAQMQACGDVMLRMNVPEISGITTQDPLEIVQYLTKTCSQHFIRNIDELSNSVPREVVDRLKSFMSLDTHEDIASWHEFCKTSPYSIVVNWYNQKIAHPWYLPSLNRFLSRVPNQNWDNTPRDSNIGETAHAGRNGETKKIGRPILAGILDARYRDNEIADRLESYEINFTSGERFNLPLGREKRSASRRQATYNKIKTISSARVWYEELEKKVEELSTKKTTSLARRTKIAERLDGIKAELTGCSSVSTLSKDLKSERKLLRAEDAEGLTLRKEWAVQIAKLKEEMKELKDNELKGARVHDARPSSSSPTPGDTTVAGNHIAASTDKENLFNKTASPRRTIASSGLTPSPLRLSNYPSQDLDFPTEEEPPTFDLEPQFTFSDSNAALEPFDISGVASTSTKSSWSPKLTNLSIGSDPHPTIDIPHAIEQFELSGDDLSSGINLCDDESLAASMAIMDRFLEMFPEDVPSNFVPN